MPKRKPKQNNYIRLYSPKPDENTIIIHRKRLKTFLARGYSTKALR